MYSLPKRCIRKYYEESLRCTHHNPDLKPNFLQEVLQRTETGLSGIQKKAPHQANPNP